MTPEPPMSAANLRARVILAVGVLLCLVGVTLTIVAVRRSAGAPAVLHPYADILARREDSLQKHGSRLDEREARLRVLAEKMETETKRLMERETVTRDVQERLATILEELGELAARLERPQNDAPPAPDSTAVFAGNGAGVSTVPLRAEGLPRTLGVAVSDSLAVSLVLVPPGDFVIGTRFPPWNEVAPVRSVTFTRPFYIGRYEVTVAQFAGYLTATAASGVTPAELSKMRIKETGRSFVAHEGASDLPIVGVTHHDALGFCRWLAGETGLSFSLPTEVEWEYAARGPEGRLFPWGNDWLIQRVHAEEYASPAKVGSYPDGASWCGAEDMAGNVFEWCADRWDPKRYDGLAATDPQGLDVGSSDGVRVIRGGSYANPSNYCRSSTRVSRPSDGADPALGFRVKLALSDTLLRDIDRYRPKPKDGAADGAASGNE